jgi:hypothetical protein
MKRAIIAAGFLAASLLSLPAAVEAKTCKANYYNGEGHSRSWEQGVTNARGDWSYKVRHIYSKAWARWSKAKVRDDGTCNESRGWPHTQWCNVEAYPCK